MHDRWKCGMGRMRVWVGNGEKGEEREEEEGGR